MIKFFAAVVFVMTPAGPELMMMKEHFKSYETCEKALSLVTPSLNASPLVVGFHMTCFPVEIGGSQV